MNLRPRALIAEPSTWLAALICAGLCALAWFGYRAQPVAAKRGTAADHRGREAADLLTRADSRHVRRADVDSAESRTEPPRLRSSA